jgi:hypothetical protein
MAATMGQPKPQASLSSSLLARKGQARPAMRPQGFSGFGNLADAIDDLGWNDMGQGDEAPAPAPQPVIRPVAPETSVPVAAPTPSVLRERAALKDEIETPLPSTAASIPTKAEPVMTTAALTRIGRKVRAKQSTGKSAFTLRLDAERHLKLRLASAVCGRSAQQLVTEALDVFLATVPEIDGLAASLPPRRRKHQGD